MSKLTNRKPKKKKRVGSVHADRTVALSWKKTSPNYSELPDDAPLTRREKYNLQRMKQRSDPNQRRITGQNIIK